MTSLDGHNELRGGIFDVVRSKDLETIASGSIFCFRAVSHFSISGQRNRSKESVRTQSGDCPNVAVYDHQHTAAMRRVLSAAGQGLGAVALAGAAYIAVDEERRHAAARGGNVIRYAVPIAWGYGITLEQAKKRWGEDSDDYRRVKEEVDTAAATNILRLSDTNGGAWTKFSQALSMNASLPSPYIKILSRAQDQCRPKDWDDVKRVLEEDLGRPASEVFASIEQKPVAAASLAQVHRAVLKNGQTAAVKIQYPNLRRDSKVDLSAIFFCALLLETVRPDFGYSWLVPDFAQSLTRELNFLQEARNAERVAAMFSHDKRVKIPAVYGDLTSERVLTMEWIDGVKLNDAEGLKRLGIKDTRDVAKTVVSFMAESLFVTGLVHLDLHWSNALLRRDPSNPADWQFVPIDWGMVRRETSEFRLAFCDLWIALILSDHERAIKAIERLGMDKSHHEALSLILVYRPVGIGRRTSALGGSWSEEDVERLKKSKEKLNMMDVNRFMQRLPRDLLFVLRGINFVRAMNQALGGTTYERFTTMGEAAVKGLNLPASKASSPSLSPSAGDAAPGSSLAMEMKGELDELAAEALANQREMQMARQAAATGGGGTAGSSLINTKGVVHGLVVWLKTMLQREPVKEPLTYLNAVAARAAMDDVVDAEIARKKDEVERQRNPLLFYLWTKPTRWARERKDLIGMQAMLAMQQLVWKLILGGWIGTGFKAYDHKKDKNDWRNKDPG